MKPGETVRPYRISFEKDPFRIVLEIIHVVLVAVKL